jgi:hypothetical protein
MRLLYRPRAAFARTHQPAPPIATTPSAMITMPGGAHSGGNPPDEAGVAAAAGAGCCAGVAVAGEAGSTVAAGAAGELTGAVVGGD